jgi:aminomethyltransferase
MPIPTPFHSRTAPLCESHEWREWAGYLAASTYLPTHEREYYAIRNACALIDVSPLFKYEIYGPQAEQLINRIITRDVRKCADGQMMYTPWCDDDGQVIDDGTVARLAPDRFRMTSADPNLAWFEDCGLGMDAQVEDVSESLAALAVQGPLSRRVLKEVLQGIDLNGLRYYRLAHGHAGDIPVTVSRTGYTGDLGFEVWIAPQYAGGLWDRLVDCGQGYGILPAGMVALDIARIEAGLILIQVDYKSSRLALISEQKSSPYELNLGWTVDLSKSAFVGRQALVAERERGSQWALTGLEVDWLSLELAYGKAGLVPEVAGRASRAAVPVYRDGRQVGQATSLAFSPTLKKYLAIASLESLHAAPGTRLELEVTVEYVRRRAAARVTRLPFFNPTRKRA